MGNLKKHIYKRYLLETKLTDEEKEKLENSPSSMSIEEALQLRRLNEDDQPILIYSANMAVLGFPYKINGFIRTIPLPDPILMYFHNAYLDYKQVTVLRKDLLKKIDNPQEDVIKELYNFFGHATGVIINLFTTLEAFVNRCIPSDGFEYKKEIPGKRIEIYTKELIERNIPFDEKVKKVLTEVYKGAKKPFNIAHPPTYAHIENLKNFRDDLIHLKSSNKENKLSYEVIFKKLLDYKYEEALNAVKDFCNHYHPRNDYITECPCSHDD